jgi:hypothetical protein
MLDLTRVISITVVLEKLVVSSCAMVRLHAMDTPPATGGIAYFGWNQGCVVVAEGGVARGAYSRRLQRGLI